MKISIRIIGLFSAAILLSFIPEIFPAFFGDWICNGCNYGEAGVSYCHAPQLHWGYRHWLYFLMGITLFITQAVYIIIYAQKDK